MGIQSVNLPAVTVAHEVLVNDLSLGPSAGVTGRMQINAFAAQLTGTEVIAALIEGATAGRVDVKTWAALAAITGTRAGQPALVYGPDAGTHTDPVAGGIVPNTGRYAWSEAEEDWERIGGLPSSLIHALNTGVGTANAVQATTSSQFDTAAYGALITVNFVADNDDAMTLSLNDETPRDLVTNSQAAIPAGYIKDKMSALVQIDENGDYRLFSYGDATAVQAAAEAALALGVAAAALAQAWAEGTEPGGVGTKSAKEWAQVAEAATVYNRVAERGTIDAGAGPYDMGVTIGSEENIDIKLGGVPQDHDLYTVDGTEFTFTFTPEVGLPWEGVVQSNVRELGAPSDGTVNEDSLGVALKEKINKLPDLIFATDYASNQFAADAAIAQGKPLFVPQDGGIVVRVPEDIPDLQDAINTVASWIFPSGIAANQNFPYASPELVKISLEGAVLNTIGKGYVWPLAKGMAGDKTVLAGRDKTAFNITSLHSQTGDAGLVFLTCNVSAIPSGLIAGSYIGVLLTAGSAGEHYVVRGCWQVAIVDVPNTRITFKVKDRNELSIPDLVLTSASCFFWPTGLQFQGMPDDGNDRGGIEVPENCQLRIRDIVLIGDPNGGAANAATTNGIIVRKGGALDFDQHMGLHGWPRKGVWFVETGEGRLSYSMISACDQGFKGDTGSRIVADYTVSNGNISNNVASGIGTIISAAPLTACGCLGASLFSVDNGDIITSLAAGLSRISNSAYGALAEAAGVMHLNDIPVVGCGVGASARPGSSIFTNGVFTANTTDYKPALNTPTMGALVSSNFASDL